MYIYLFVKLNHFYNVQISNKILIKNNLHVCYRPRHVLGCLLIYEKKHGLVPGCPNPLQYLSIDR